MTLFDDFIVPMTVQIIVIWVIMSTFAIFLYNKIIPDEEKRKKIITGYLFISLSIFLSLIIMLLSFFDK